MYQWLRFLWLFISLTVFSPVKAQIVLKEINRQNQVWVSVNNTSRLSTKWGFVLDLHERRNNFFKDASFHFIRLGAAYWLKENIIISAGYAHLWLAPSKESWEVFSNENRIYKKNLYFWCFHTIKNGYLY